MNSTNLQHPALVFDMDGVILDTESLVRRCWHLLAPEYGLDAGDLDQVFLSTVGTTHMYTGEILRTHYGADFPSEQFNSHVSRTFHAIADTDGIPVKPGVRALLDWAKNAGFRIGLASSTREVTIRRELEHAQLYHCFDHVIGGDRIARSKPYPDIYEAACRALAVLPADAFAIEDSYNGIRAAAAAGMRPVMVPDLLPPTDEMRTLCHSIFPDLAAFRSFLAQQFSA